MQAEEKMIQLKKPIVLGNGADALTYSTLHLREPTAGELEKAANATTAIGMSISLISAVANIPRSVVEKLSQRDFKEADSYLGGFTEVGPETGEIA